MTMTSFESNESEWEQREWREARRFELYSMRRPPFGDLGVQSTQAPKLPPSPRSCSTRTCCTPPSSSPSPSPSPSLSHVVRNRCPSRSRARLSFAHLKWTDEWTLSMHLPVGHASPPAEIDQAFPTAAGEGVMEVYS